MGIGQRPKRLAQYLDTIYPMVYPSHFGPGRVQHARPNAQPGRTVALALRDFDVASSPASTRVSSLAAGLLPRTYLQARGRRGPDPGGPGRGHRGIPALERRGPLHSRRTRGPVAPAAPRGPWSSSGPRRSSLPWWHRPPGRAGRGTLHHWRPPRGRGRIDPRERARPAGARPAERHRARLCRHAPLHEPRQPRPLVLPARPRAARSGSRGRHRGGLHLPLRGLLSRQGDGGPPSSRPNRSGT